MKRKSRDFNAIKDSKEIFRFFPKNSKKIERKKKKTNLPKKQEN